MMKLFLIAVLACARLSATMPTNNGKPTTMPIPEDTQDELIAEHIAHLVDDLKEIVAEELENDYVIVVRNGLLHLSHINDVASTDIHKSVASMRNRREYYNEDNQECAWFLNLEDDSEFWKCTLNDLAGSLLYCAGGMRLWSDKTDNIDQILDDGDLYNQTHNHSEIVESEPAENEFNDSATDLYTKNTTIDYDCVNEILVKMQSNYTKASMHHYNPCYMPGETLLPNNRVCEEPSDYRGERKVGLGPQTCDEAITAMISYSFVKWCPDLFSQPLLADALCGSTFNLHNLEGAKQHILFGEFLYSTGTTCCLGGRRKTFCNEWAYRQLFPPTAPPTPQ